MNLDDTIARLATMPATLDALLASIDEERARREPAPGKWSILDIVNHLGDEERNDFRRRLKMTLEDPTQTWPPIDPEGSVEAMRAEERSLPESLADFRREREASLAWLRTLEEPDWERAHHHPHFDPLRAGDLMASWIAHDLLHIRQIVRSLWELHGSDVAPFQTRYAGEW